MTQKQLTDAFLSGGRFLVGEYRSSKAEIIHWRDKVSGKPLTAGTLTHIVECGNDSVKVMERTAEDFVPTAYKSPLAKGQRVCVLVDSIEVSKGILVWGIH